MRGCVYYNSTFLLCTENNYRRNKYSSFYRTDSSRFLYKRSELLQLSRELFVEFGGYVRWGRRSVVQKRRVNLWGGCPRKESEETRYRSPYCVEKCWEKQLVIAFVIIQLVCDSLVKYIREEAEAPEGNHGGGGADQKSNDRPSLSLFLDPILIGRAVKSWGQVTLQNSRGKPFSATVHRTLLWTEKYQIRIWKRNKMENGCISSKNTHVIFCIKSYALCRALNY